MLLCIYLPKRSKEIFLSVLLKIGVLYCKETDHFTSFGLMLDNFNKLMKIENMQIICTEPFQLQQAADCVRL